MAPVNAGLWVWSSDFQQQPASDWVPAGQVSACPGLRTSLWVEPTLAGWPLRRDLGVPLGRVSSRLPRATLQGEEPCSWDRRGGSGAPQPRSQTPSHRWPLPAPWDPTKSRQMDSQITYPTPTALGDLSPQNHSRHHWASFQRKGKGTPKSQNLGWGRRGPLPRDLGEHSPCVPDLTVPVPGPPSEPPGCAGRVVLPAGT